MTKGFWISAKRPLPRRCRAGQCFDQAGHGIAAAALTGEQIAALQADPHLVVEEVEFSDDQAELLAAVGDYVGPDHTDEALSECQHTLRAYLAGLHADGKAKPKVAEARKATGIAELSAAEIGAAWKALG